MIAKTVSGQGRQRGGCRRIGQKCFIHYKSIVNHVTILLFTYLIPHLIFCAYHVYRCTAYLNCANGILYVCLLQLGIERQVDAQAYCVYCNQVYKDQWMHRHIVLIAVRSTNTSRCIGMLCLWQFSIHTRTSGCIGFIAVSSTLTSGCIGIFWWHGCGQSDFPRDCWFIYCNDMILHIYYMYMERYSNIPKVSNFKDKQDIK